MATPNQHSGTSSKKNSTVPTDENLVPEIDHLELTGVLLKDMGQKNQWQRGIEGSLGRVVDVDKLRAISYQECLVGNSDDIDLDWFLSLKSNRARPLRREDITEIIYGLQLLMIDKNYRLLDQVLNEVLAEDSSEDVIVTVLRGTFSVKNKLKNWRKKLDASIERLSEKGINYNSLLSGLVG